MQNMNEKRKGALVRRQADVEKYTVALETGNFEEALQGCPEEVSRSEKTLKRKLNIAREQVHTLQGRLKDVLITTL